MYRFRGNQRAYCISSWYGCAEESEPVIISGPVSFVVRGSEPSRSVVTESLVPVSSAVTGEGESDVNNVGDDTSDADDMCKLKLARVMQMKKCCLMTYKLLNRTRQTAAVVEGEDLQSVTVIGCNPVITGTLNNFS